LPSAAVDICVRLPCTFVTHQRLVISQAHAVWSENMHAAYYRHKDRISFGPLFSRREILSNERHQSCGLLDRERSLAARTLKIPWANTPILESVNNMFRKTMGASVMLGEARKGVNDRTSLQFKQFILALQGIDRSNTTQCSSNKCHVHTESLSPPIFGLTYNLPIDRVNCIHYNVVWIDLIPQSG